MKLIHLTAVLLCLAAGVGQAQSGGKQELFTSHFDPVTTPFSKTHIPIAVCVAVLRQADEIIGLQNGNGFEGLDDRDLLIASDNLRACATTALARFDRDLAVGLYGETVAVRDRRERETK